MSLISDPWDDEDVEVDRLEHRLRQVRTVQHRSYSTWNDSTTTNRPVLAPVEVKPAVRIMKRDTTTENTKKKDETEVVKQTLAEKEQAYAEARQRILGIPSGSSSPTHGRSEVDQKRGGNGRGRNKPRGGGGNRRGGGSNQNGDDNRPNRGNTRHRGYRGRGRGRANPTHD